MPQPGDICPVVPTPSGKRQMVNMDGYLMVEDKHRKDLYYWECKERKNKEIECGARARTVKVGSEHRFRGGDDHNHAPRAEQSVIATARAEIKERAKTTGEAPAQIIQTVTTESHPDVAVHLPNRDALRQLVKRQRCLDMPAQPTQLEDIDIPMELRTVNGSQFLAKDVTQGDDRIIIFATPDNMKRLMEAGYWMMDGTFKTSPSLFRQLYTIHAPVGTIPEAIRVVPLVYALMSSKSEECYTRLFQELNDYADQHQHSLAPSFIVTDFEQAAINASKLEFAGAQNKGCLFHLGQSIYRRIESSKLKTKYGTDVDFALKMRHLAALAFLPAEEIPSAFDKVKTIIPEGAEPVITWFEENYVHGRVR